MSKSEKRFRSIVLMCVRTFFYAGIILFTWVRTTDEWPSPVVCSNIFWVGFVVAGLYSVWEYPSGAPDQEPDNKEKDTWASSK